MSFYRSASDSLILYLAKKSIEKFKELFPDEEPFIKILCLRDKKLISEYKSGKRSWRKIEVTGENADVVDIKGPVVEKRKITTTRTREFFEGGENVTNRVGRGKNTRRTAMNTKSKHIVDVREPDLTYVDRFIEKEVAVDDLSIMLQTEINTNECNNRYDYISIDRSYANIETVDTGLEIGQSVFIDTTKSLSESFNKVKQTIIEFKSKMADLGNKTTECESLKQSLNELELKVMGRAEVENKTMERVRKILNTTESSVEIAEKYVKLQEKLNQLKKQLSKYTTPDELNWSKTVKEKGFVLAIQDLVHFWWDLSGDGPDSDYDND
jgi:hypothetical protein